MDDEKRQIYDRYGKEGLQNGGAPGGPGGDPFDMFADFFGGGRRRGPPGKPRGRDAESDLGYTLKDFFNGANTDFNLELQNICDKCSGTGSKDGQLHPCKTCRGTGRMVQKVQLAPGMFQQFEQVCPHCGGQGQQIVNKCDKCTGSGVFRGERSFTIHLAPGTPREHIEVYQGQADQSPQWNAGDLKIHIKEKPEGNLGYRRVENNLYRTEVLSLKEALNGGWNRTIPFLDDYENTILLKREKGKIVNNGDVEVIEGKGMPLINGVDEFGNLYIQYHVVTPGGSKESVEELLHHDEL
ncbi:unnamed protein product [Ambrosiozyma monospora]|uniref:Unnamed protein product n=1 Tax=Ambrosiozyma monospora TaxID=43982 RepID=A0A9W6T4D3_AMBMO|nr:unnamed protein product [Ambrosiozyma monospora]